MKSIVVVLISVGLAALSGCSKTAGGTSAPILSGDPGTGTNNAGTTSGIQISAANRDGMSFQNGFALAGSRNETVSAILQLSSPSAPCQPLGLSTAEAVASFYKMETYTTTEPSYVGAAVGPYYDPLVPATQICGGDLVWMDLAIQASATPGTYALPYGITLNVWKMTMPSDPTMPIYINMNGYDALLAHGLADTVQNQAPLTQTYDAAYRAHRIEPYGEYIYVYPQLNTDGVTLNLTEWSQYDGSYSQLILTPAIAAPILYIPDPSEAPTTATLQAINADALSGTIPTQSMAYVWDEGEGSATLTADALARAQLVKQYAPNIRVMTTRVPSSEFDPYVDIYFPVLDEFESGWTETYGLYTSCMAQGSCTNDQPAHPSGTPMMLIDAPTIDPRAFLWVNYKLGAVATLYYNGTQMIQSAWTNQYVSGGNGDGTLVYPDKTQLMPDISIRMKMLRQGSYDVEYLNWAKAAGISYTSPVTSQTVWSKSFDDYQSLRDSLGTQLNGL